MKIPTLLKICRRNLATASKPHLRQNAGFTIIELVVVMLMIAILSAVAAPGWLGFINNQRLRASQSSVYGALQLAQSFAKRDKLAWQASFRFPGKDQTGATIQVVQWAIHPATTVPTTLPVSTSVSSAPNVWYSLQDNISISTTGTGSTNLPSTSGIYTAIFNRQGCLVDDAAKECTDTPTVAGFSTPQRITLAHSQLGVVKCAVVTSLLGAMRTGEDSNINPENNDNLKGCRN
jgi:prepilin-type N-terminal cleavage/methylation domain-containing protein